MYRAPIRSGLSFPFPAIWMAFLALALGMPALAEKIEYLPGIKWPEPSVVTPGATNALPPADAVILFDGKDLSAWKGAKNWKVENGVAIVGKGAIRTKQGFGDCQLHIEWAAPKVIHGEGQGRGNSGVYLMSQYEIQILDSYQNTTYFDGQAGAIYKQSPPMVNAMRPPGEWNTYDILFTAPRFDQSGSLLSPAYVTVIHNGVVVQNHFELQGPTHYHKPTEYESHKDKLPIKLQDHGNPVRFRNIWVREIQPIVGRQLQEPSYIDHQTGESITAEEAKKRVKERSKKKNRNQKMVVDKSD